MLCCAASLLTGCMTARNSDGLTSEQQVSYNYFVSQGMDKNRATLLAVSPVARELFFDDKTCQSYGAKPGSDAYVSCRAQLEGSRRTAAATPPPTIVQAPAAPAYVAPAPSTVTCMRTGTIATCNQM